MEEVKLAEQRTPSRIPMQMVCVWKVEMGIGYVGGYTVLEECRNTMRACRNGFWNLGFDWRWNWKWYVLFYIHQDKKGNMGPLKNEGSQQSGV